MKGDGITPAGWGGGQGKASRFVVFAIFRGVDIFTMAHFCR